MDARGTVLGTDFHTCKLVLLAARGECSAASCLAHSGPGELVVLSNLVDRSDLIPLVAFLQRNSTWDC